jgi:hypothetical protein
MSFGPSSATCVHIIKLSIVIGTDSPEQALDVLKDLKLRDDGAALLLAD